MGMSAIYLALSREGPPPPIPSNSRNNWSNVRHFEIGRYGIVCVTMLFARETILAVASNSDVETFDPLDYTHFLPRPKDLGDLPKELWPYNWPESPELAALVGAPPAVIDDRVYLEASLVQEVAFALSSHSDNELSALYASASREIGGLHENCAGCFSFWNYDRTYEAYSALRDFFIDTASDGLQVCMHWECR